MRVISGSARRKTLYTAQGLDIRPTLDRVKESIFNIIAFDVAGASVLDLFCGSGALGIEALSRGAESAVFVDNSPASVSVTEQNLKFTGLDNRAHVVLSDSIEYLKHTNQKFDIIFIDPPYESGLYESALSEIISANILNPGGQIIAECDKVKTPPFSTDGFTDVREKIYGRVKIMIMKE